MLTTSLNTKETIARTRLSARHEQFAQFLADGLTQEEAYVRAGWAPKNARSGASKLLKQNSNISRRVDAILAEQAQKHSLAVAKAAANMAISKEWLMGRLVNVIEMGLQAIPVLDSRGNPTGEFKQNLAAVNRAVELLGREFGAFVEKQEVRTGPLDGMSHEDLKTLRAALEESLKPKGAMH